MCDSPRRPSNKVIQKQLAMKNAKSIVNDRMGDKEEQLARRACGPQSKYLAKAVWNKPSDIDQLSFEFEHQPLIHALRSVHLTRDFLSYGSLLPGSRGKNFVTCILETSTTG